MRSVLRTRIPTLALTAIVLLSTAVTSWAQTETGKVSGVVTDPNGGVLPGAAVKLTLASTGTGRATVTDKDGRFTFSNLLPGSYMLETKISGFKDQSATIVVGVGANVSVDVKLLLAGATETV